MSDPETSVNNDSKRKDAVSAILLVVLIATFAGSYFTIMKRNKTIHDMNEEVVAYQARVIGLESTVSKLEDTIGSMEESGGGGTAAGSRRGTPLTHEYLAGDISKAWRSFQTIRARMEQPPVSEEELETRITTEDVNGVRGADWNEIQCFEKLIGPDGSPFLKAIFESNVEEVRHSGDAGSAAAFAPGLENLLSYYVTVGEPESLAFIEELLTGQIAQVARTKFDGNYFTFATGPVVTALEHCAAESSPEETVESSETP